MATRTERGRDSHRRGLLAEAKCMWWLRCFGYRIIERRFKTPVGEIDIVALRGGVLVFVEVKARSSVEAAALAITPKTMARMQRAANYFLMSHQNLAQLNLRLDVMFVTPFKLWPTHIRDSAGLRAQ